MKPFDYTAAENAESAIAAAGAQPDNARYLAGGTNLVDLMRLGVEQPSLLVDVNCDELSAIETGPSGDLRIGAAVRNSDLAATPAIRRGYPVLAQALLAGASPQVRNMASIGGNLLQRTRCRYFQDVSKPCNKRTPGSGCPARSGDHHNLAILGASPSCVATHPSDMAVALTALDATIEVRGAAGPREVPITDFYRLPGDRPDLDTTLEPGDLITAVRLPPPTRESQTYRKVRDRASFAFALASVAALLQVGDDGRIIGARLALGAVAHRPWRATTAEAVLIGSEPGRPVFRRAIEAELAAAEPLELNAYKVPLVARVVTAVLADLVGSR